MQRSTPSDPPKLHIQCGRLWAGATLPTALRRSVRSAILAIATLAVLGGFLTTPASAGEGEDDSIPPSSIDADADRTDAPSGSEDGRDVGVVQVLKVSGFLDPVLVDFVLDELAAATAPESDVIAVVLQLNSTDAVVSATRMDELTGAVADADIPITVWVGPSGSNATGGAAALLSVADVVGVAPGSHIEVTADLAAGLDLGGRAAVGERVDAQTAAELGLVDNAAPVLGEFVVALPGVETVVVDDRTEPVTPVRFAQVDLIEQVFHTVASPPVAYLLLLIGGGLLVFELFTAGVGIAGMVGATSLLLSAYGLGVLPTNTWAVVVLVACFPAFAIDVQTGVPRFWTGVGTVLLVAGSLGLFPDTPPSWIALGVGIIGTLLAMLGGMPAMVRTRFSTPTIGRDWMIGEVGTAVAAVDPDGVVTVRGAPWRARTNRATPIAEGDEIKVVALDGLTLEIEPVTGAARDYRERGGQ